MCDNHRYRSSKGVICVFAYANVSTTLSGQHLCIAPKIRTKLNQNVTFNENVQKRFDLHGDLYIVLSLNGYNSGIDIIADENWLMKKLLR